MTATSYAPRTGRTLNSAPETSPSQLEAIVETAMHAAHELEQSSPADRRRWLYAVADVLEANVDELVALADSETALGVERLTTEVARTVAQTRFYGDVAVEGSFLDVAKDSSVGLSRYNRPLGPVAVFGASNFPFLLGILGHDMSSAIAAGCPVVAKAHDAHIGLCLRLHELATAALADAGAPLGVFGLVTGFDAGVQLVSQPQIAVVAFTGSERGGRAIWQAAQQRPVPIPVYAEMGTVNPVVVTQAQTDGLESIAAGFVTCYTNCSGQYCSKPGLLFAPKGSNMSAKIADALSAARPAPVMLTEAIARSVSDGLSQFRDAGARTISQLDPVDTVGWAAPAAVLEVDIDQVVSGNRVLEECFGAVAIVSEYSSLEQLHAALDAMQPALVAAVWTPGVGPQADPDVAPTLALLSRKVGRVVVNGWTTGAGHSWAQNHGGPWPATSNPSGTSIGAASLGRFVRPVAFHTELDAWLPPAVQAANPWQVTRRVDGRIEPSPNVVL